MAIIHPRSLLIFLLFICLACNEKLFAQPPSQQGWVELSLPLGWTISVPDSFAVELFRGTDSYPGRIYSASGSIHFNFDCGRDFLYGEDCSLAAIVAEKKAEIKEARWQRFPLLEPIEIKIDTINGLLAVIEICKRVGERVIGMEYTSIEMYDCPERWGLIVDGPLTDENEALLLKMFKTIKRKKQVF